jgi:hypothetical protein
MTEGKYKYRGKEEYKLSHFSVRVRSGSWREGSEKRVEQLAKREIGWKNRAEDQPERE